MKVHGFSSETINNRRVSNPNEKKPIMSDDFDIIFESPSPCCGEVLSWEWDEPELRFGAECGCMKRYHLRPITALVEHDAEDFEDYDE